MHAMRHLRPKMPAKFNRGSLAGISAAGFHRGLKRERIYQKMRSLLLDKRACRASFCIITCEADANRRVAENHAVAPDSAGPLVAEPRGSASILVSYLKYVDIITKL